MLKERYQKHCSTRYRSKTKKDVQEKRVPQLYEKRENCCGCSGCYSVCPVGAITMEPDEEGFLYPVVDSDKCICCYKCLSVCVFKEEQKKKGYLV